MDRELTLVDHLNELRKRIIVSLIALGVVSVVSLPFATHLLRILKIPASGLIERLAFFSPQEAFLIYMRIAFLCGLIISMPIILYQIWAFVCPAIEERLKRYSVYFIFFCSLAFIAGCLFAYFILIPPALRLILTKLKIINHRILRKKYKYAIMIIFIVAAIITPTPDAFNMFMLALPMFFLYELSIWIAFFAQPKHKAVA